MAMRARPMVLGGLAALLTFAPVALADGGPETLELTSGANGPADNAVISQDKRVATVVAFDSSAANLVAGDANGQRDVFVLRRALPFGENGTPWQPGALRLISQGRGGGPANGPSYLPAVSGDSRTSPACVAFISEASNLVAGDTNGRADAFVADLSSGRIQRVSVTSTGAQARGASYAVAVDGRCRRVAFISDARNLRQTSSPNPSRQALRTTTPRAGSRQVYVRGLGGPTGIDTAIKGTTFLLTARGSLAANGDTANISMAPNGKDIAFDSTATNLDPRDRNATSDVYLTTLTRIRLPRRRFARPQTFRRDTTLVSRTAAGLPGNGPSSNPAVSADAATVAFTTAAADLVPGASPAITQIALAKVATGQMVLGSRTSLGDTPGNGPSDNATLTVGGIFVVYDTAAANLPRSAPGGSNASAARSVMLYTLKSGLALLISQNATGPLTTPAARGMTSAHGNYVVFSGGDPLRAMLRYVGPQ